MGPSSWIRRDGFGWEAPGAARESSPPQEQEFFWDENLNLRKGESQSQSRGCAGLSRLHSRETWESCREFCLESLAGGAPRLSWGIWGWEVFLVPAGILGYRGKFGKFRSVGFPGNFRGCFGLLSPKPWRVSMEKPREREPIPLWFRSSLRKIVPDWNRWISHKNWDSHGKLLEFFLRKGS